MVPAYHYGCGDSTFLHHGVDYLAELRTLPVAEPADTRRKTLELDLVVGLRDPTHQGLVLGEFLADYIIGRVDVLCPPRKRDPAEGPPPLGEEGPDVFRHETWYLERVLNAGVLGHLPDVVAILKRNRSPVLESQKRSDMLRYGCHR